jgi:hypothetical protein
MKFFFLNPRSDYAGYLPTDLGELIRNGAIPEFGSRHEKVIEEYLGNPPRKTRKHGSFHKSALGRFVINPALDFLVQSSKNSFELRPTKVVGREIDDFYQFWVTNSVDCLDLARTKATVPGKRVQGRIGIIQFPVFDKSRWDGSDLFVVPQDEFYNWFVTERFIEGWRNLKCKGASFAEHFMDDGIRC